MFNVAFVMLLFVPASWAQRSGSKTTKIDALPANIDQLNMLQTLIVSGNELTELPAALSNIPTLKRVVARNNQLTSLPEGMENLTELKTVDVKGNPFDDGAKVQTIRRFGEDIKIKVD